MSMYVAVALTISSAPAECLINLSEHLLTGSLKRRQHCGPEYLLVAGLDCPLKTSGDSISDCLWHSLGVDNRMEAQNISYSQGITAHKHVANPAL